MKFLTALLSAILLSSIIFFNTNCKKTQSISYQGFVYDSLSSRNPKGVGGVVVLLSACSGKESGNTSQCMGSLYTIESATTEADGSFNIQGTTKLKNQSFYVGIEGSSNAAANIGYSLSNLPSALFMRN